MPSLEATLVTDRTHRIGSNGWNSDVNTSTNEIFRHTNFDGGAMFVQAARFNMPGQLGALGLSSADITPFGATLQVYLERPSSSPYITFAATTNGYPSTSWNSLYLSADALTGTVYVPSSGVRTFTHANLDDTINDWVNNNRDRYILSMQGAQGYQYKFKIGGKGNSTITRRPSLILRYGFNLETLLNKASMRSVEALWDPVDSATDYKVTITYLPSTPAVDGLANGTVVTTTGTSYKFENVPTNKDYTVQVVPRYTDTLGLLETQGLSTVITPTKGTPTISATGDTPIRKNVAISVTNPESLGNYAGFRYEIEGGPGPTITTGLNAATSVQYDLEHLEPGDYVVRAKARYGDLFSPTDESNFSTDVNITLTQPTITGLTATTNQPRQIDLSWTKISDADHYTVSMDGGAAETVSQPGTTTVSYQKTNIKGGTHSFVVTPIYTNGYEGAVTVGQINGTATIPTPSRPTVVGDSPAKRQIRATSPSAALPSAFHSASHWQFRRDSDNNTISPTQTGTTYDFSAVPSGTRFVAVRAVWADGDVSAWSTASTSVIVTSPPPASIQTRHTSAPTAVATTSIQSGGTIPTTETYYVSVSINHGGNRTTETVNAVSRAVNESSASPLQVDPLTIASGNQTIRVSKPTGCTGTSTWNVYIGTDKSQLKRATTDLSSGTATYDITSYTAPTSDESRRGEVDLSWAVPSDVGDLPTTYKVERAKATPFNSPTGTPGAYVDVTNAILSGLYDSNLKYYTGKLDTGYWYFRVSATYSNDASNSVEVSVLT